MGLFFQMDRIAAAVHFDATGGTPVIAASRNISSITDNGVGDFTANFANPLANANYYALLTCRAPVGGWAFGQEDSLGPRTVSALHFITVNPLGPSNTDTKTSLVIFNSP